MGYSCQPEHGVNLNRKIYAKIEGRTAGGVQYGGVKRPVLVTTWEQPTLRPGQPPIAAENPQQLRREHDVTVLAGLTLLDPDPQSCGGEEG
jgi:hypothetical protein